MGKGLIALICASLMISAMTGCAQTEDGTIDQDQKMQTQDQRVEQPDEMKMDENGDTEPKEDDMPVEVETEEMIEEMNGLDTGSTADIKGYEKAVSSEPFNLNNCNTIVNEKIKIKCIDDITTIKAVEQNDQSLCNNIQDEEKKAECIEKLEEKTVNDPELLEDEEAIEDIIIPEDAE